VVEGRRAGEPARVHWFPRGSPDFITGDVGTVPATDSLAGVNVTWLDGEDRHVVWGTIPEGEVDTLALSTRAPAREGGLRLLQLLDSAGISVGEGLAIVTDTAGALGPACRPGGVRSCPGAVRLARLPSPALAEVVRGILEPSQNWMTEQLVRALAVHRGEVGSWSAGLDAVSDILQREAGVDSLDLSLRDGSGLSAYNLVTPRAVVAVLRRISDSPLDSLYRDALAAPGEADSTLEERLLWAEGRLQAKTGTISNVNSLSGYLAADSGRELVFSILTNGSGLPAGVVRERTDRVVALLARYH